MSEILIVKEKTNKGLLDVVTLKNEKATVTLISNGAGIFRYQYLGKDLVIKPETIDDYNDDLAYYGKTIGRTSGRLVVPSFKIDEKEYKIKSNQSQFTQLHGGENGFSTKVFSLHGIKKTETEVSVTFRYISKDLEEGFPGELTLDVTYLLHEEGYLLITYNAVTTKDTLCNITSHGYFNLNQKQGTIDNHEMELRADYYLDIDEHLLIKSKKPVENTVFDFRVNKAFKKSLAIMEKTSFKGFDHTFIFSDSKDPLKAIIYEPEAKIGLNVYTSYPAIVIYTHNFPPETKLGAPFTKDAYHSSFTLECQYEPGGIHHSYLNSAILRKGEVYQHYIKYEPFKK